MMKLSRFPSALVTAAATAAVLAGCDAGTNGAAEMDTDTLAEQPRMTGMPADQEMFEARLEALQGSGVTGTATFTIENGQLQATLAATGLPPNTRVPQHVHMNQTCDDAGGIFLNLDDRLSAPSQGQPQGDAYPQSNDRGELRYEASRSLDELRSALSGSGQGGDTARTATAPADTADAVAGQPGMDALGLGNRVINLHDPQMQAIACGTLQRMEHGQQSGTQQPR